MNAMHFKAARLALALAGAFSTVGASAFDQIPLTLDEAQSAAEADRANAIRMGGEVSAANGSSTAAANPGMATAKQREAQMLTSIFLAELPLKAGAFQATTWVLRFLVCGRNIKRQGSMRSKVRQSAFAMSSRKTRT